MTDPDLLAIRRKRRQEKRCLACGVPVPRAALCKMCRQTLRYCPRCEDVYAIPATETPDGRATLYCPPCRNVATNGVRQPRDVYLASVRASQHPKLKQIIRLYRDGLSLSQIGRHLGKPTPTVASIIRHARRTGRWPRTLRRAA